MSIFDTFKAKADEYKQKVTDVYGYLNTRVNDNLVKVGLPPAGNLTPLDIAKGKKGAPAPIAPPKAKPASIANANKAAVVAGVGIPAVAVLAIAAGLYFLLKRK